MNFYCLLVDDDEADAKHFADTLNRLADTQTQVYFVGGLKSASIKFIPFWKITGDTARSFLSRFEEHLTQSPVESGESASLFAIIFDYRLELMNKAGDDLPRIDGVYLAKQARRLRPAVARFLLTYFNPSVAENEDPGLFVRGFRKEEAKPVKGGMDLFRAICGALTDRYKTPFWDALTEFARRDKIVLHAMAAGDSKAYSRNDVISDFIEFYGPNYFNAEASSTIDPLDSLLSPHGSLKDAQTLFAETFGANDCHFVTNGTSTANRILHAALTRAGDYVLIDDSCHISHHYALASTGAHPWYLPSMRSMQIGVAGVPPIPVILAALENFILVQVEKPSEKIVLPRCIVMTNCSFDGIAFDPKALFQGVYQVLIKHRLGARFNEIVFLIDEAWFAFARFHPRYAAYSAMSVAAQLSEQPPFRDNLRLYVTQSTHKTLFAFRQASVILVRDPCLGSNLAPLRDRSLGHTLKTSLLAHTTTSPHLGMLASLDVARRQVALQGKDIVDSAILSAQEFTRAIREPVTSLDLALHEHFEVLDGDSFLAKADTTYIHDSTKLTLRAKYKISGALLKQELWKQGSIQINKFGPRTVLLIFTPGISPNIVTHLKSQLLKVGRHLKEHYEKAEPDTLDFALDMEAPLRQRSFVSAAGEVLDDKSALKKGTGLSLHYWMFGDGSQKMVETNVDLRNNDITYVSGSFVAPYPPGYPLLVPGQCFTGAEVAQFVDPLGEIHGAQVTGDRMIVRAMRAP